MKFKLMTVFFLLTLCFGCASQEAYMAHVQGMIEANAYRQQPGIEQEFDSDGRMIRQKITMPDEGVKIAQIKDSEWAQPLSTALSGALNIGLMGTAGWAITKELSGAIKSVQPNISGSYNNPGGNMAGGNVEIPTTTTTTTTTETNGTLPTIPE